MARYYKKTFKKKKRRSNKKRKTFKKTIKIKGGGGIGKWVGVPDRNDPTGFGWLSNSFLRPCNKLN
tara:strand:+ start:761 stop:958 length:198 start_codon:yes stop_codon:yes gene_type:complete